MHILKTFTIVYSRNPFAKTVVFVLSQNHTLINRQWVKQKRTKNQRQYVVQPKPIRRMWLSVSISPGRPRTFHVAPVCWGIHFLNCRSPLLLLWREELLKIVSNWQAKLRNYTSRTKASRYYFGEQFFLYIDLNIIEKLWPSSWNAVHHSTMPARLYGTSIILLRTQNLMPCLAKRWASDEVETGQPMGC